MPKRKFLPSTFFHDHPQIGLAFAVVFLMSLLFSGIFILKNTGESQDIRQQAAGTCAPGAATIIKKVCQGNPAISCDSIQPGYFFYVNGVPTEPITTQNMCKLWSSDPTCIEKTVCQCPNSSDTYCGAEGTCLSGCYNIGGRTCAQYIQDHCIPPATIAQGQPTPTNTPTCALPTKPEYLVPSGGITPDEYLVYWNASQNAAKYTVAWDNLYNPQNKADTWEGCGVNGDYCIETTKTYLDSGTFLDQVTGIGKFPFVAGMAYKWYVIPYNTCGQQGPYGEAKVSVPTSCNQACTVDENCSGVNVRCLNNVCRNIICSTETDCTCPPRVTSTPIPTSPTCNHSALSNPYFLGDIHGSTRYAGPVVVTWSQVEGAQKYTLTVTGRSEPYYLGNQLEQEIVLVPGTNSLKVTASKTCSDSFYSSAGTATVFVLPNPTATPTQIQPTVTSSVPFLTPTITPETGLPEAGNSVPTIGLLGIGVLILLIGIGSLLL